MRRRSLVLIALSLLGACTNYAVVQPSSATVARWDERDISELVAAIGPYDTTSVKGDWRSYDWFRFGNCHVTARTSLEGKIQKLTLEGTGTGCDPYIQKLRPG